MKIHEIALNYIKTAKPPVKLGFIERPGGYSQARLLGRSVMTPDLNLKGYQFRAVIDWIEISVTTIDAKQFKNIQDVVASVYGRKPYVKALEQGPGGTSRTFRIRLQEPTIDRAIKALEALGLKYPLAEDPEVTSVEISVDAIPRTPSDDARARVLGAMHRCFFTDSDFLTEPTDRPRFSFRKDAAPTFLFNARPSTMAQSGPLEFWSKESEVPVDATLSIGRKDGPVMWKMMDKTVDQQNPDAGTLVNLPDVEKRARIEVTLGPDELRGIGIRSLQDMKAFNYSRLQGKYFQFMLPTFLEKRHVLPRYRLMFKWIENRAREKFLSTGILGLEALRISRESFLRRNRDGFNQHLRAGGVTRRISDRRGQGSSREFVAWKEMNNCMATALRRLKEREEREGR